MDEERRKAVRVRDPLFVQYCFDDACGGNIWDITTVQDISETGLSIKTLKPFEAGALITLRLKVPFRPLEKIEVAGKVIGSLPTGQGSTAMTRIEFNDLSEDTKSLFREYVAWVVKSQGPKNNAK